MHRRTLLTGCLALALATPACGQSPEEVLRVLFLKGSIAPRLIQGFRDQLAPANQLQPQVANGIGALFRQLQQWHNPESVATGLRLPIISRATPIADWVSLGDYWLTAAIQQRLIHPLPEVQEITHVLSTRWKSLLQRDPAGQLDPNGPLWAVPYRWGSLVLVYARRPFQRLGWEPTHWQDLWRPELTGRVSLPSHPRLALGLMLKGLGESVNHPKPDQVLALVDLIGQGRSQIKTYAASDYLQPLLREDTWLAVGWSTDVLPRLEKYRQLAAVVPDPGTLLSADVWVRPNLETSLAQLAHQWVRPKSATPNPATVAATRLTALDQQWLSYWLNPAIAESLQVFAYGASPLLLAASPEKPVPPWQTASALFPTLQQRQASEFLLPLTAASQIIYQTLWQQLGGRE